MQKMAMQEAGDASTHACSMKIYLMRAESLSEAGDAKASSSLRLEAVFVPPSAEAF
jgi:hypothetical protein